MKTISALTVALTLSTLATLNTVNTQAAPLASNMRVSTWSVQTNTPSWNQAMGVKTTRQGCSGTPTYCVNFTAKIAQANHVGVTLAVPLTTATPADATQYSVLSKTATFLGEVSIDDFVDQFRALPSTGLVQPWRYVAATILNLKSANSKLAFGITLYEDDLANPILQNASLPAVVRGSVDYVHLFLHYREDGLNYASYVQQTRVLFPHAHIVAGAYAYDHRAYLPCTPKGVNCTEQQDLSLIHI